MGYALALGITDTSPSTVYYGEAAEDREPEVTALSGHAICGLR